MKTHTARQSAKSRLGRLCASLLALGVVALSVQAQVPTYRTGDIVRTNFGFQNRYLWTNDNGQVFTPSNTVFRLSDFLGKIVMFEFFAVW